MPALELRSTYIHAIHLNNAKYFRSILEKEGWPRDSAWSDFELLTKAINLKRRRIVNVLLKKGCRVAKDGYIVKTFHDIVKLDWIDIAKKFLECGARVYDQDCAGNTALHVAFFNHTSDRMLELLLQRFVKETSFNVENVEGLSVWHIMCAGRKHEYVKHALDSGFAEINSKVSLKSKLNSAGYTALHFAVEYNRLEIARYLLECNANIYARDRTGSTPLHLACELRNVQMIDLIFSHDKLNDNVENAFGLSHFMAACAGSNVSIVKDFLNTAESQPWSCPKTLVTSQVKEVSHYLLAGYTPLHLAAEFGRYETVRLLLSYEPPCCVINAEKLTPGILASKGKYQCVFLLLMRYCINYKKNKQHEIIANKFNSYDQTSVKTDSDGYQVPDVWFIRQTCMREYPRYVTINGKWGKTVIPLYAPMSGVKYDLDMKFYLEEPYVRTYYVL